MEDNLLVSHHMTPTTTRATSPSTRLSWRGRSGSWPSNLPSAISQGDRSTSESTSTWLCCCRLRRYSDWPAVFTIIASSKRSTIRFKRLNNSEKDYESFRNQADELLNVKDQLELKNRKIYQYAENQQVSTPTCRDKSWISPSIYSYSRASISGLWRSSKTPTARIRSCRQQTPTSPSRLKLALWIFRPSSRRVSTSTRP